ncbi:MAG TPA: hypothetical protein VII14_07030 [Xanthobacteraceae bacterium]
MRADQADPAPAARANRPVVMAGLVPIGANLRSSLPGLTRQSIDLRKNFLAKKMDARVKPAHDELAKRLKLAPVGLVPAIHALATGRKTWMRGTSPRMTGQL